MNHKIKQVGRSLKRSNFHYNISNGFMPGGIQYGNSSRIWKGFRIYPLKSF